MTLLASTRFIPASTAVDAVIVVASMRTKLVVVPMPPEPEVSDTLLPVMSVPKLSPVVIAPLPLVVIVTSPPLPAFNVNELKATSEFALVVSVMFVFAAREMSALNVIPPVFASPMMIVPAVMKASSASVRPSTPAESAAPRLIAVPFVN